MSYSIAIYTVVFFFLYMCFFSRGNGWEQVVYFLHKTINAVTGVEAIGPPEGKF